MTRRWGEELARIEGFKIGIVWQGSRGFLLDRWRSFPLAQFAPLARLGGVRLISLQKGFGTEQIAAVDFPVVDLSDRLDEATGAFMDTAAVICNLDLVITPDTAVGHLAGALARRSGWPCRWRPIGVGGNIATIPPGIPPCDYSARRPLATGRMYLGAWPTPLGSASRHRRT